MPLFDRIVIRELISITGTNYSPLKLQEVLDIDKTKPRPLKPCEKNKAGADHRFPCPSNIKIWNGGDDGNNNHCMMHISAPNTLQLAAGNTMGMPTVSCERWWPTGLKQTQITVLGAVLVFLLLEPQCKPSVLLQGAPWYISAYPGCAAILFLKLRFKLRGERDWFM